MAEQKKDTPTKTTPPGDRPTQKQDAAPKPAAPSRSLLPAAASSDPSVHQLLAELQTARSNGSDDEALRLVDGLADLGYE